jgi:hypothetical protein
LLRDRLRLTQLRWMICGASFDTRLGSTAALLRMRDVVDGI